MKEPLIAAIAVLCNVGAQLAMKYDGRVEQTEKSFMMALLSPWLLGAVTLYGLSFLLTVRVFAVNSLSVASPTMAGSTFLLITLSSWLLLGETLSAQKLIGIVLIFLGIVVLTRG